jgi:1-acyl-sn-glycerol-3-phosphate acyltransferase
MSPPTLRRRLTVAFVLSLAVALIAASPVLLTLAALAHALGRRKPLIAVRLLLAYCTREVTVVAAAGALWLLSGAGRWIETPRMQGLHWSLLRWYVRGFASRAMALLSIAIREDIGNDAAVALTGDEPVIVLSRHAGPGDTVFLIDRLLSRWSRTPSVVLRQAVALDPVISLLTARLPHGVIDSARGDDAERVIEHLAAGLRPGGALLLYPEGGNFTRERRRSALASLRRRGRQRAAAAAQQMDNVLPPRPSGVLAALRGAPRAPIIFVAHTGLGLAAYPREIYREMPIGRTLRLRIWLVPRGDVPEGDAGQVQWLNRMWQEIDDWVASQGQERAAG